MSESPWNRSKADAEKVILIPELAEGPRGSKIMRITGSQAADVIRFSPGTEPISEAMREFLLEAGTRMALALLKGMTNVKVDDRVGGDVVFTVYIRDCTGNLKSITGSTLSIPAEAL